MHLPLRPSPAAQSGLTLVELLVTLAVLAILASLAVPSFRQQIAAAQVSNASNEVLMAISRARTEAMRNGSRVSMCKSNNGTQCDTSTRTGWETGWILFADPTRNDTNATVDSGESVSFKVGAQSNVLIRGNGALANYLSFSADGRPKQMNGAFLAGQLRVCNPSSALTNDNRARDLCISSTGRTIVIQPTGVDASCPAPTSSTC